MAAIIQPRAHHHGCGSGTSIHPSRPPRHLSAVAVAVPTGTGRPGVPLRLPAEPLLPGSTLAGMVAAVVVAALLAIGIGAGAFSALVPTPGSAPLAAGEAQVVEVEAGDSVWSIARTIQPEGDVRPLVHRIVQANGAEPLQPGQRLVVPA